MTVKDAGVTGSKGANLGELMSTGVNVPNGFVVTSLGYDDFIESAGLIHTLEKFLSALDYRDLKWLNFIASRIRQIISATPWPEDLLEYINSEVNRLGGYWAVRSSAIGEDGVSTSFAGQHSSFLKVASGDVPRRIKECFASLFEPRALMYRLENNLPIRGAKMAVVCQQMAPVEVSGVMFTKDYNTGEDKTIIEAVHGLGEGLVSGALTPDHYEVSAKTAEVTQEYHEQVNMVGPGTGSLAGSLLFKAD